MFDSDEVTERMVELVVRAISTTRWKMSYAQWIVKIGARDDSYWENKWREFDALNDAINKFDTSTLYRIIRD
jgi:hypothetical protein